jgi:hypothetical protein
MMAEISFTKKQVQILKSKGAKVISLVGSIRQQPGLPDRILIHKRIGIKFLEFKGIKTITQLHQKRLLAEINEKVEKSCFIIREPNIIEYCSLRENKAVVDVVGFFEGDQLLDRLAYLNGYTS